jgi:serine protease Do
VPSNLARHVIDDLIKFGEVQRGSIEFRVEQLTPELAAEVGVTSTRGAIVTRMLRDSASYDNGLRPGDVIVKYDGRDIEEVSQLTRLVADAKIGATVTLTVLRGGRTVEIEIPIVSSSDSARRRR